MSAMVRFVIANFYDEGILIIADYALTFTPYGGTQVYSKTTGLEDGTEIIMLAVKVITHS
jgi:hypothetical protein